MEAPWCPSGIWGWEWGAAAGGLHRGGFSGGGEERVGVGGIVGVPSERSENRRHAGER